MTTIACPPYAIRRTRRALIVLCSTLLMVSMSDVVMPARDHSRTGDDGREGSVWVVNRDLGELAVFDAKTGKVVTTLLVGAGAHDICISEHARKAYITAETINTVTTVDTRTLAIESIAISPLPHHIEPSHDGRTVYVSLASHTNTTGTPHYAAIDTDDNSVRFTTTSGNPAARSHGLYPSLRGKDGLRRARSGRRGHGRRHQDGRYRFQHYAHSESRGSNSPPGPAARSGYRHAAMGP